MCPECGETTHVYYANGWCANCGWHRSGVTTQHENFARDPRCRWCSISA